MSTLNRGSFLNQGFIPDENENWTEIALQPSDQNYLQVPGQSEESGQEPKRRERPKSEGGQSQQRVKKYLKDQINERINKDGQKDKRKDTWAAVITSVMSNGKIANYFWKF